MIATIPAVIFGVILKKFGFTDLERNVAIVAWNTLLYGMLMLIADRVGPQDKTIADVTLPARWSSASPRRLRSSPARAGRASP